MKINSSKFNSTKVSPFAFPSSEVQNPFNAPSFEPVNAFEKLRQWSLMENEKSVQAKWDFSMIPIKYYINQSVVDPEMLPDFIPAIDKAFVIWTRASYGVIRFMKVFNLRDANISVDWSNETAPGRDFESGSNELKIRNGRIVHADIKLIIHPLFDDMKTKEQRTERVRRTVIHEIGHSLGLNHSNSSKDLMFHRGINNKNLSTNDISRLNALYGINKF